MEHYECTDCDRAWKPDKKPEKCPFCGSPNVRWSPLICSEEDEPDNMLGHPGHPDYYGDR